MFAKNFTLNKYSKQNKNWLANKEFASGKNIYLYDVCYFEIKILKKKG